jgi:hypothetical protein
MSGRSLLGKPEPVAVSRTMLEAACGSGFEQGPGTTLFEVDRGERAQLGSARGVETR